MSRLLATLLLLLVLPGARGGEPETSWRVATPGWRFSFPADHGSHDAFQTEWWYFTGHLEGDDGRFGFEVTFFRAGVDPSPECGRPSDPWRLCHLALAHFAVTDIDRRRFRYHEKLSRMSPYTAAAATSRLDVFNEGWSVVEEGGGFRLRAAAGEDAVDLLLVPRKPPAIHGRDGVSVKSGDPGNASHYYSMSRLAASGTLRSEGRRMAVRGEAWMDHEFSSSVLGSGQEGWDWFSLQLSDGTELMLYQMRRKGGGADSTSSGSWIDVRGAVTHLPYGSFTIEPTGRWRSKRSGGTYPMGWKIAVPSLGLALTVDEAMEDQELVTSGSTGVTYWEGAVDARGTRAGGPVTAKGYVEMTGYDRPFTMRTGRKN